MLDYITPILEFFSAKNLRLARGTYSICKSYAPTHGCSNGNQSNCNDGNSNQAICVSRSSNCGSGDVHENSLCQTSEESECQSTGSQFECKKANV